MRARSWQGSAQGMKSLQSPGDGPEDLNLRFRILSAEYSALVQRLGSTSAVSAARTNLYFVFLSATGVALALISNASHFTREFQVLCARSSSAQPSWGSSGNGTDVARARSNRSLHPITQSHPPLL